MIFILNKKDTYEKKNVNTSTRADYGKLKSLILRIQKVKISKQIFMTGMHNIKLYVSYGEPKIDIKGMFHVKSIF